MKFRRTRMRNFRLHSDTDIEYPDGVVGILGDNEAGKSNVIEAAMLAMFGAKVTRGTKPGIRWHGAPDRHTYSVEHHFELSDELYRIERDEKTAVLYDSRGMLAEGTTAVNEYIPGGATVGFWDLELTYPDGQNDVLASAVEIVDETPCPLPIISDFSPAMGENCSVLRDAVITGNGPPRFPGRSRTPRTSLLAPAVPAGECPVCTESPGPRKGRLGRRR